MRRLTVTDPFVLQEDVVLVPCAELHEHLRRRISFEEGDFALSQPTGRARSQVIDGDTAALLALFREPRTLVSAVAENSRALGKDPRARLEEMLSPLADFVKKRILVPAGSPEQKAMRARYDSGAIVGGWEIVRCIRVFEDSEIYQLRLGHDLAALKIAKVATAHMKSLLGNEIAILGHLDGGGIAPRLIGSGVHETLPYLILEWIPGVDPGVAAAQRCNDRASLIELCAAIAAAYAALHARGVLHGDVNLRNVLVGDRVTLIDFGYSRLLGRRSRRRRAGVEFFLEPELFAAQRQGRTVAASPAGEQYSVAVLLYFLIAGRHYLDFRYEREEMALQVESDPPLPFAERGIAPWPEVERILFRALEKHPTRRYGSMAELAAALAEARDNAARQSLATPLSAEAHALLETTLRSFARDGELFASGYPAPRASINFGCAGAAVGLLRIAEARSDPAVLALADVWRSRAAALIGAEDAFFDDEALPELAGRVSPYHTESGIHAAAAMVAAARGDSFAQRRAVEAFLLASQRPCEQLDLTLGRSGSLLAAALLLELGDDPALRAFGSETMRAIWHELDAHPPLAASPAGTYFGIAHGWAGYAYAALRWCAASGDVLPPRLVERLHEYVPLKIDAGRGVYWIAAVDHPAFGPGWCNGTAGQVFLFTLAHRTLGDPQWLELAERCAWNAWDEPRSDPTLCCGTAGRAYALLNLYKATGDHAWLSRARQLANHAADAAASSPRSNTLWQGELGVAVLIADLASPENARMPFFE